jgi:hypothetical protein
VDWPGAHVWRELAEAFPDAKVIHTVRPEEKWWASFDKTIGKLIARHEALPMPPHVRDILSAWNALAGKVTFGGVLDDREIGLAAYRKRTEEVRAALPPERLLVFDVADGWGPLCAFLGVPVPDEPFPHHNLRADFWDAGRRTSLRDQDASKRSTPTTREGMPLSDGCATPSITGTSAKSKGLTPCRQATFTPYSCGFDRRWWWV